MIKNPQKTVLMSVICAAWLVFAGVFAVVEHGHDCEGESCRICLELQIAEHLIEAFFILGARTAFTAFVFYAQTVTKPALLFCTKNHTLLRIRLNC